MGIAPLAGSAARHLAVSARNALNKGLFMVFRAHG